MARKKRKTPTDPAEISRQKREREAYTRATPSEWGLNEDAQALPQNASVARLAATREKTARAYRWDCFSLLASRGGLSHDKDVAMARLNGVRRFEETLAQRMRLEGTQGTGSGAGRPIPISDRSVMAAHTIEAIEAEMTPFLYGLLMKLVSPAVQNGQTVNNWRAVVQAHAGEFRHIEQSKLVATCSADLLSAWQAWDQRERQAA